MARPKGKVLIKVHDIIGKRLDKLQVVAYAGYAYDSTKGGIRMRHFYYCACDCGQIHVVRRSSLLNNKIRSCGCLKRKHK